MYFLEISEDYPNSYWLECESEEAFDHMLFKDCVGLAPSKVPVMTLRISKKVSLERISHYDYLFSSGPDVISARLARLLFEQVANGEIQILPVVISNGDDEISGFGVVNYLKCEPAIDIKNSTFKPLISSMPNGPRKYLHTVLLDKKPIHDVFRAEENREEIVVSDRLRQILESSRIKGVRFVKEKKR